MASKVQRLIDGDLDRVCQHDSVHLFLSCHDAGQSGQFILDLSIVSAPNQIVFFSLFFHDHVLRFWIRVWILLVTIHIAIMDSIPQRMESPE